MLFFSAWDLSKCPHNPNGSHCWADSAFQECPDNRQGAYNWVAAGGNAQGMWNRYTDAKCGKGKFISSI